MTAIALDSNLLLLLVVGRASRDAISRHKRLKAYEPSDYDLLFNLVDVASELIVTPNAWTEVSNIAPGGLIGDYKIAIIESLATLVQISAERYVPSADVAKCIEFASLGLADTAWLVALDPQARFLTVDLELFHAAQSRGLKAEKFNHLRVQSGFLN